MNNKYDKDFQHIDKNLTLWLSLDPEKVKQRIKGITQHFLGTNTAHSNISRDMELEKIKERINQITAKLDEVLLSEEEQLNNLNSSRQSENHNDHSG